MLKRVGERTAPWGTPLGKLRGMDDLLRRVTCADRREMKLVSHRESLGGRFRSSILSISLCLGTVSKALLMSMVASAVRLGGTLSLKPSAMSCVSDVRYVVVLCMCLKPCWWSVCGVNGAMR